MLPDANRVFGPECFGTTHLEESLENYLDEFCIIIIHEKDIVAFVGNCIDQRIMCWGWKRICEYLKSPK